MGRKRDTNTGSAEHAVHDMRRATRRKFSAEEKILIVLNGLRGKDTSVELCGKQCIAENLDRRWSKDFLEAGTKRPSEDAVCQAPSDEVKDLRLESRQLKEALAASCDHCIGGIRINVIVGNLCL